MSLEGIILCLHQKLKTVALDYMVESFLRYKHLLNGLIYEFKETVHCARSHVCSHSSALIVILRYLIRLIYLNTKGGVPGLKNRSQTACERLRYMQYVMSKTSHLH